MIEPRYCADCKEEEEVSPYKFIWCWWRREWLCEVCFDLRKESL